MANYNHIQISKKVGAFFMSQYKKATLRVKENLTTLREIESLVDLELSRDNFFLLPDKLIAKINDTLITKLPQVKNQQALISNKMKKWWLNQLALTSSPKPCTKTTITYLNPQKSTARNYEAIKRDKILCYKEQLTTFLTLFTEEFNYLALEERQVMYYSYFVKFSEVKIANVMNLSQSSVGRLKNKATIKLDENIQKAFFIREAFCMP